MIVVRGNTEDEWRLNMCLIDNIKGERERRHHMEGNLGGTRGRNIVSCLKRGSTKPSSLVRESGIHHATLNLREHSTS
jgi:hypothetical protein